MSNKKEDMHFRVLRLLENTPEMTQRQIAETLGVSLGSVNSCLRAIIAKGLANVNNFHSNDNKTVRSYVLTSKGVAERAALTKQFLERKLKEYQLLKAEIGSLGVKID